MKIRPIDERALIKPLKEEERKVGSIIIPDTAKERPQMGEVVALGDDIEVADRKQKKMSEVLKVGDQIVYARYGGTEIKMDDQEYLLVGRNDILAVVQK
ncbi:co-chaperone GroES [candidate division KSB1 bacterium]|nr:co-chaperone GroES [candidate division KSB1 bacterium]